MEKLTKKQFIENIKNIKYFIGSQWKKENDFLDILNKTENDLQILVTNGIDSEKLALNTRTIKKIQSNAIAFLRPSTGMET